MIGRWARLVRNLEVALLAGAALSPCSSRSEGPAPRVAAAAACDSPRDTIGALLGPYETVGAASIGYGGGPSNFFLVSRALLSSGEFEAFEALTTSEFPTWRCMGLLGIALKDARRAIPILLTHTGDPDRIELCPGGCICDAVTVGRFAQAMLYDPYYLGHQPEDARTLHPRRCGMGCN